MKSLFGLKMANFPKKFMIGWNERWMGDEWLMDDGWKILMNFGLGGGGGMKYFDELLANCSNKMVFSWTCTITSF